MNSAPYTPEAPASPQQAQKLLPAITELRLRYLRSGYTPLPCVGKAPALSNWPKARIDATQIRAWPMLFPTALNIGIRSRYNPAADIDVYDADLVHTIERALLKYLPQDKLILRRVGVAPKRLIPFCCLTPFPKCAIAFKSPDGKTHRVEVLADGQQYIAEGWHPDSGEPYGWMGEKLSDVLPTKLPVLTQDIACKFLADVGAIVADKGWTITNRNDEKPKAEHPRTHGGNGVNRHTRNSAYARAALDRECEAVANAAEGCRNNTLNVAAFSLFQLVAGGELDEGEVIPRLTDAAAACGLIEDDGAKSVENTIASGAKAGLREPRHAPQNDEEAHDGGPDGDGKRKEQPSADSYAGAGGGHASAGSPPPHGARRVELVPASTFEQRPIDWIWKPRLARGKITLLAGDPGVGKSSLTTDIVARASTARMWPDNSGYASAGSCIILSAEDAANDTLCPRLAVAGADMDRVRIMRMAGRPGTKSFSLATDLPLLAAAIERLGDVILLVIDPLSAYLGDKIDTHQTAAVRGVLEPLDAFAARYRCGILGVTHPPKAAQSKAINAFTGSLAFVAAARTAFIAIEEPETGRRLLLPVKSNIGPTAAGLAYRLEPTQTPNGIEAIRVLWDPEPVDVTANEAIAAAAEAARGSGQQSKAEEFLMAYLEAGPMPADKVLAAAEGNGISKRTLERAKGRLRVVSEKDTFRGGWTWRLPR
jgi:AAA domain-containing protein/bifunctional DNA primase/polymerase-like protein